MELDFTFFFYSIAFGIGLAMDAFSVSLANGLNEPCMRLKRMCGIAGTFAFFQALMPLLGWTCVHTIVRYFQAFEAWIPWIALVLLGYIGGTMLYDGIKHKDESGKCTPIGLTALLVQGVATSIDALSVGFTISDYIFRKALLCAGIIAFVTFVICLAGLLIGRKMGIRLAGKAGILGGIILLLIGIEIFLTGILG